MDLISGGVTHLVEAHYRSNVEKDVISMVARRWLLATPQVSVRYKVTEKDYILVAIESHARQRGGQEGVMHFAAIRWAVCANYKNSPPREKHLDEDGLLVQRLQVISAVHREARRCSDKDTRVCPCGTMYGMGQRVRCRVR